MDFSLYPGLEDVLRETGPSDFNWLDGAADPPGPSWSTSFGSSVPSGFTHSSEQPEAAPGFVDHASAVYAPGSSGFELSAPPVPMALHQQSFSTFKDGDQGSDISRLKGEIADLKKDRDIRAGEYNLLLALYNGLLRRLTNAMNPDLGGGPLKQTDYPQVKFWYKEDWTNFCADNQADVQFIEDRHGIAMDALSASMIGSLAQAIWVGFGTEGTAPSTWEEAEEKTRERYYRAMCAGFFELRLCDANWKAEKVAANSYHLWLLGQKLQICPPALDGKRVRSGSMSAGPSKKLRVAGAVDSVPDKKDSSSRMRKGVSTTPRNLCALDWCREVGGSSLEFKEYFDNLPPDELKKYHKLSKEKSRQK